MLSICFVLVILGLMLFNFIPTIWMKTFTLCIILLFLLNVLLLAIDTRKLTKWLKIIHNIIKKSTMRTKKSLFLILISCFAFIMPISYAEDKAQEPISILVESDFSKSVFEKGLTETSLIENYGDLWTTKKNELTTIFADKLQHDFDKYNSNNKWEISTTCPEPSFILKISVFKLDLDGALSADIDVYQINKEEKILVSQYNYSLKGDNNAQVYLLVKDKNFKKLANKFIEKQSQVFFPYMCESIIENLKQIKQGNYCSDFNSPRKWRPEFRLSEEYTSLSSRVKEKEFVPSIEFVNGFQKSRHLNLGVGLGVSKYDDLTHFIRYRKYKEETYGYKEFFSYKYKESIFIPIFLQAKYCLKEKRYAPYFIGRTGCIIADGFGLLNQLGTGVSYRLKNGRVFAEINYKIQILFKDRDPEFFNPSRHHYSSNIQYIASPQIAIGYVVVPRWH